MGRSGEKGERERESRRERAKQERERAIDGKRVHGLGGGTSLT